PESNAHGLIGVLPDALVGRLGGRTGLVLQTLANFLGFLDGAFQFCSQLTLLALQPVCFVHKDDLRSRTPGHLATVLPACASGETSRVNSSCCFTNSFER